MRGEYVHTRGLPTARLACFIEPQRLVHGFMAADKAEFIDTVLFSQSTRSASTPHSTRLDLDKRSPRSDCLGAIVSTFLRERIIVNVEILISIKRFHRVVEVVHLVCDRRENRRVSYYGTISIRPREYDIYMHCDDIIIESSVIAINYENVFTANKIWICIQI